MSNHMVIYRGPDGKPGYHQTEDIHDAVGFVEQLRNDQGVEHARIFRLEELSFSYRPYFRVELQGGAPAVEAGSSTPAVAAASSAADSSAAADTSADADSSDAGSSSSDDSKPSVTEKVEATESAAAPSVTEAATVASESSAPTITSPASGSDNGVGARRGLFGR